MKEKYARLSSVEKDLIFDLTKEGMSLRKIRSITGFNLTTIYYQVRKFKPKQRKDFLVNLDDFRIGELIGAFAGDGSHTYLLNDKKDISRGKQHRIRYHLSLKTDVPYAHYLRSLLIKMNLNPHLFIRNDNNVIDVAISSKDLINFIKRYLTWEGDKTFSVRLKDKIEQYSDEFLRGFARGLMDTDGFLNSGNAICACISKDLINNLADIFTKYGLEITRRMVKRGGNRRDLYYVRVRRQSLNDYEKLISFSNKYKIKALNNILRKS